MTVEEGIKTERQKGCGLAFSVADCLEQVEKAWELVYNAYTRIGLIDPNPWCIHTVPQAARPQAAVLIGVNGDDVGATTTAIRDGEEGLPLEGVYARELDAKRRDGRELVEVGLFADRREMTGRSLMALFETIRWTICYCASTGADNLVIGVHPHHAGFYTRYLGFEQFGEERMHPTVKNHPVVALTLEIRRLKESGPLPRGLAYIAGRPLAPHVFAGRYQFPTNEVNASRIGAFLRTKAAPAPCADAA